jgi:predicted ATPase/DNA-binding XRE family transcriptional regulator
MSQVEHSSSFGAWVKARRRALGLTQSALAQAAGVAEVTVRKIEADERRPSGQVAALLAERLRLDGPARDRFLLAARAELSPDQLPLVAERQPAALPVPPTALIGREADLAALRAALTDEGTQLLTLTGPPGIGKTRLAIELARAVTDQFAGAVTFVALAPLADPELVAATLAQALDVAPAPGEPLLRPLLARLQGRQLLILDNFEQVLPAAGLLAELLAQSADLRVVVTSRAALRLRAEHEYPVPPLALPEPGTAQESITGAEDAPRTVAAVQLFAARARAVAPGFRLSAANTATVSAICTRLDGLPLAIELAAARTRSMSLTTLLERLDRRLDLLTDGPPDLPSRQRTLRGAIGWSYELLRPPEQRLLAWLGAFVGGFTLDDLEAVLALAPAARAELPAPAAASAVLTILIDHSLVQVAADDQGALRFGLLETVRAFARERLASDDNEPARRCHARHYHALALELVTRLTTDARGQALARLEGELGNLRAAFDWSLAAGDAALAGGLNGAAISLWIERGRLAEGRAWSERLLALPPLREHGPERMEALRYAADIVLHMGDYAAGIALARESLALAERLASDRGTAIARATLAWGLTQQGELLAGLRLMEAALAYWRSQNEPLQLALALDRIAWVQVRRGAFDAARQGLEEGIALLRGGPHSWTLAELLWELSGLLRLQGDEPQGRALLAEGLALMERAAAAGELPALLHLRAWQAYRSGDYRRAATLFDENIRLLRQRGDTVELAWAINHGAAAYACAGEGERAQAGYAESLARFRAHGHRQGEAAMLHNLGYVALSGGEPARAAALFHDSLTLFQGIGSTWSIADAVAGVAAVAAARGDGALAARLLAAVEAAHAALDASGELLDPSNMLEVERTRAALTALLAPAELARLAAAPLPLAAAAELAAAFANSVRYGG